MTGGEHAGHVHRRSIQLPEAISRPLSHGKAVVVEVAKGVTFATATFWERSGHSAVAQLQSFLSRVDRASV